jgi:hypothetical protein
VISFSAARRCAAEAFVLGFQVTNISARLFAGVFRMLIAGAIAASFAKIMTARLK